MVECGQVDRWHGSRSWLRPFVCQLIDRGSALLSDKEIASQINSRFLQPMESFQRIEFLPSHSEDLSPLTLSEPAVLSALKRLNSMKAAGLDGVVWWRRSRHLCFPSYSSAKQKFRGAETPVILEDGASPQAKTCYQHQQRSSSDLPNLRNI